MVGDEDGGTRAWQWLVPGLPGGQRDLRVGAAPVVVARGVEHARGVEADGLVAVLEDGARVTGPCLRWRDGDDKGDMCARVEVCARVRACVRA